MRLDPHTARGFRKFAKKKRIDWKTRLGTVVRVGEYTDTISVRWDDRKSLDMWPKRALQVVWHAPQEE